MKQPHKHRDAIIAWANGEELQYKPITQSDWIDVNSKNFNWNNGDIECRIKPQKKVVPYDTFDEAFKNCFNKILYHKEIKSVMLVTGVGVYNSKVFINYLNTGYVFNNYIFEDGSPVGKIIEDNV